MFTCSAGGAPPPGPGNATSVLEASPFHFVTSLADATAGATSKTAAASTASLPNRAAFILPSLCCSPASGHGRSVCGLWQLDVRRIFGPRSACASAAELGAKHRAPWAGEKTGLEQERHDLRLADRLAVEALHREPRLAAAPLDVLDQCCKREAQPSLLRLSQRHE